MIELLVTDFIDYVRSPNGGKLLDEYAERKVSLGRLLSEESIDSVKPEDLDKVFANLLTVDAYPVYRLIAEKYGYQSVLEHFKYFLYGSDPLERRFDAFFTDIPEMPQLAVMEVATFAQPRNFCIWDDAAKQTIIYIGHSRMHGLSEASFLINIAGIDYVWAKLALNHVRQILSAYTGYKCDFVDVYVFAKFTYEKYVLKKEGVLDV